MQPWPWYVSGPMIALVMALLIFTGKNFGMSANLRTMCSMGGGDKLADFFDFDWKKQSWNLFVVIGAIMGGFIAATFLSDSSTVILGERTTQNLLEMGFSNPGGSYVPPEFFTLSGGNILFKILILVSGGFLIGFGARYAGGCTSGHAISGLSDLQLPSLIAVIGFFAGGLLMTHLILPLLF